jgi:hypothetical protein
MQCSLLSTRSLLLLSTNRPLLSRVRPPQIKHFRSYSGDNLRDFFLALLYYISPLHGPGLYRSTASLQHRPIRFPRRSIPVRP